jgi:hypothetical protein
MTVMNREQLEQGATTSPSRIAWREKEVSEREVMRGGDVWGKMYYASLRERCQKDTRRGQGRKYHRRGRGRCTRRCHGHSPSPPAPPRRSA